MKPLVFDFGDKAIPVDRLIMVKPDDYGVKIEYDSAGEEYITHSRMSYEQFIAKYGQVEEQNGSTS